MPGGTKKIGTCARSIERGDFKIRNCAKRRRIALRDTGASLTYYRALCKIWHEKSRVYIVNLERLQVAQKLRISITRPFPPLPGVELPIRWHGSPRHAKNNGIFWHGRYLVNFGGRRLKPKNKYCQKMPKIANIARAHS